MINKLLNYESSTGFCAGAVATGLGAILIGSLTMSHSIPGGASFCAVGGMTTAGALFFTALKIDHYFRGKRIEENNKNDASYTPANRESWMALTQKRNSTIPILPMDAMNNDPNVIKSATFGDNIKRKEIINHHYDDL